MTAAKVGMSAQSKTPGRAPLEVVRKARAKLLVHRVLTTMLHAIPDYAFILNEQRQILVVNDRLRDLLGLKEEESLVGKRPGEAIGCLYSACGSDGCGTDVHCSVCGALQSVLQCQRSGEQSVTESRILLKGNVAAMDVEVTSTALELEGVPVTVVALRDVSGEKRRKVLEQVFFHDVINTAGGIRGLLDVLVREIPLEREQEREYKRWIAELTDRLIEEIKDQRRLMQAERGELMPVVGPVSVPQLLRELQALYSRHEIAEGRNLVVSQAPDCEMLSDRILMRRILGNMIKNGLEAAKKGETVTVSCEDAGEDLIFSVHNPGAMAPEVQLQLFQRSFSTKAATGRGIGTYSMKLFGERYLKGSIEFSSSTEEGTIFTFTVPRGA